MKAVDVIGDRRLLVVSMFLLGMGVLAVYGATSWQALKHDGSDWSVVSAHLMRLSLGVLVALAAAMVPYRVSARVALYAGIPLSIALLALVAAGGSHVGERAGIGRWVQIFGTTFQPVDLAKLSIALALPFWIERRPNALHDIRQLSLLLAPLMVICLLLALQPNFGSILALGLLSLSILFLAGLPLRWLSMAGGAAVAMGWLAYAHSSKVHARVSTWLALLLEGRSVGDMAWQPWQALVALGSGEVAGEGVGRSTMKFAFLPECDTDFVFAILGEEMGFVGAAAVIVLFGLWYGRVLKIAYRSTDGLAYLLALALGSMIFVYALLNLFMVTALMPVAGLPLPFLSRGGSALVTNMAGLGVLLNIVRTAQRKRSASDRWGGLPL